MKKLILVFAAWLVGAAALAGCRAAAVETQQKSTNRAAAGEAQPLAPILAEEITYYDWEGDMPQGVFDLFSEEFGVKVNYVPFESMEEAVQNLADGKVYDVVNMESKLLPFLIDNRLLAEIDHDVLTNFKNLSANFRDLTYDPDNQYSIPHSWGVTAILVNSGQAAAPVTRWSDLWKPEFSGKVGIYRGEMRDGMGIALHTLGYSANTEDPKELQAAENRLMALKPAVVFVEDFDDVSVAPLFGSGKVVVAMGFAYDFHTSQVDNPAVKFVYPEEGALLWNDNYVIPASSQKKYTAETLINFLMRPEIAAMITNELYYAVPIEGAKPLIRAEIRDDPVIFPPTEHLKKAEIILPLSPEAEIRYAEIWARFIEPGDQP